MCRISIQVLPLNESVQHENSFIAAEPQNFKKLVRATCGQFF